MYQTMIYFFGNDTDINKKMFYLENFKTKKHDCTLYVNTAH